MLAKYPKYKSVTLYKAGDYILVDSPNNVLEVFSAHDGTSLGKIDFNFDSQYAVSCFSHNGYFYIGYSSGTLARVPIGNFKEVRKFNSSFVINKMMEFDNEHLILVGNKSNL